MEGTYDNAYRKNPKTNFMLSAKRTKINQLSSGEIGGKYATVTGLIFDKKKEIIAGIYVSPLYLIPLHKTLREGNWFFISNNRVFYIVCYSRIFEF
jgi:hypothetical protein